MKDSFALFFLEKQNPKTQCGIRSTMPCVTLLIQKFEDKFRKFYDKAKNCGTIRFVENLLVFVKIVISEHK